MIFSTTLINNLSGLLEGDYNGDGKTDLLVQKVNQNAPDGHDYFLLFSTGVSFEKNDLSSLNLSDKTFTGDFNLDGKTDLIVCKPSIISNNVPYSDVKVKFTIGIFNGNDFAFADYGSNIPYFYVNNGYLDKTSLRHIDIGDYSGNGRMQVSYDNYSDKRLIKSFNDLSHLHISKITNGMGEAVEMNFASLTDNVYSKSDLSYSYPLASFKFPLYVLKSSETKGNINKRVSYHYKDLVIHKQGKGLIGFLSMKESEYHSGVEIEAINKLNSSFYTLTPSLKEVKLNGVLVSKTETDVTLVSLGSKRFMSKLNSVKEEDVLNGTSVTTSYSNYDSYGNPKTISTNWGDGISETQSLVYTDAGSWCDNKIKTITTTKTIKNNENNDENISYKKSFEYFSNGNLKEEILNPKHSKFEIKTSYQYDSFGNPTKVTVSNKGESRSKQMTYTPSGRFLASEKDNQLNETTTYSWDESKAQLMSKTTSTGTTTYEYDGFGRLVKTKYPDKVESVKAYQWAGSGGPAKAKYYVYDETSGQGSITTWLDPLGRELRTDFYGFDNKKKSISTEYNSKGQLYRVSEPYFTNSSVQKWAETYNYDNYGRVANITTPQGVTTYVYDKLEKTVKTPMSTTTIKYNALGQVTENIVNGKSVKFEYHPSGAKKNATPGGQSSLKVSYEYDILGNLTPNPKYFR